MRVRSIFVCLVALAACSEPPPPQIITRTVEVEVVPEHLEERVTALRDQIARLSMEQADIATKLAQDRSTLAGPRYGLKVRLKQSRVSLDLMKHAKDAMNAVEFWIVTDEETWNSVKVGDELLKKFRAGSFWTEGTWSSWKTTVIEKRTEAR